MRRVMIENWSDPPEYRLTEAPPPSPGPGELLVAVHTVGVNFGETLVNSGRYQVRPILPYTPGSECSGTVVAVGEEVAPFAVGDKIAASGFIGNSRKDQRIIGALADFAVIPTVNAMRLTADADLEQASLLKSNAETSLYALQRGSLKAGETLLVLGASGGTGFAAVQLGKLLGARVIASASSSEKRAIALAGGADLAIDSNATDWRDQLRAITDGRGVDVVFDPVGGAATEPAFRSLAWGGRLLVIGFAAGTIPSIPANLALLKSISLVGVNVLGAEEYEPELIRANTLRIAQYFASGALKVPPVGQRFTLDQTADAFSLVASGKTAGRIVIEVAPRNMQGARA